MDNFVKNVRRVPVKIVIDDGIDPQQGLLSSDIRNPARGDTENPSTSATVMSRRVPVPMLL